MSDVAFPHFPWSAHNDQPTSDVACQHPPWPAHICLPTSDVACHRRLCPAHTGLPTSDVAWPQRLWRAHIGQLTLDVAYPLRLWFALVRRVTSHVMTLSRSSRQHAYAHAVRKSKECETPFIHNNILIYFASFILNGSASHGLFVPNFFTFMIRTMLKHLSFVQICSLSLVSYVLKCFRLFSYFL